MKHIKCSSVDRVVFPDAGLTKGDVISTTPMSPSTFYERFAIDR